MDKQNIIKEIMSKVRESYNQAHALDIDVTFLSDLQNIEDTYIKE